MSATWETLAALPRSTKVWLAELTLARNPAAPETRTLYLSDAGHVDEIQHRYHQPRLESVPAVNRSLQEVTAGQAMSSFGSLQLLNGDGGLDEAVSGWVWEGQPVTVRLGFAGLATADFRTVFTGLMGPPSYAPDQVTVPVYDSLSRTLAKRQPAGTYSGQLPALVGDLLDLAGISSRDAALWSAWASANAFACWYELAEDAEVGAVLGNLLTPLCCWYGCGRDGAFRIGTFAAPSGDPDLELDAETEILSLDGRRHDRWVWSATVRRWASPPATAEVSQSDAAIQALNPLALEGAAVATALTSDSDAQTVLARRWALFSTRRNILRARTKVRPLALELHDQVRLTASRYGLTGLYRVIGLREAYGSNETELELFA